MIDEVLRKFYQRLSIERENQYTIYRSAYLILKSKREGLLPIEYEIGKADSKAEVIVYDLFKENGIDFVFQHPIGPYRVDFLIGKVVVEIDGPLHHRKYQRKIDQAKDIYLEGLGYKVLRVPIRLIAEHTEATIKAIKLHVRTVGR